MAARKKQPAKFQPGDKVKTYVFGAPLLTYERAVTPNIGKCWHWHEGHFVVTHIPHTLLRKINKEDNDREGKI